MRRAALPRALPVLICVACAGCRDHSQAISDQIHYSGSVDMAGAVPVSWDKVCILGPYTGDAHAQATLGFDWPADRRSRIESSDDISLLVFVRDVSVVEYVDHPRREGDFSTLDGRCFRREDATFKLAPQRPDNWPLLVPAADA